MSKWRVKENPYWLKRWEVVDAKHQLVAHFQREEDAKRCVEAVNSVEGLREALESYDSLVQDMTRLTSAFMDPDAGGMSNSEYVVRIIGLLDGVRCREAKSKARATLAKEDDND